MSAVAEDIWSYSIDPDSQEAVTANMVDAIQEFKSQFDKESLELQLLEMENVLTHNSGEKAEVVHGLFREVHSLKGTSAMLKIDPLTHYLHIYEDVLGVISKNVLNITAIKNTEVMDYFLQSLDLIERIIVNLCEQPGYVFKDHREFFGFYIRMIMNARQIVSNPNKYLEIGELNENNF